MGYTLFSYSYFYAYLICRDPDGKYRGDWAWNEENDTGRGNPAMSPDVTDTLRAIKKNMVQRVFETTLVQCHSLILIVFMNGLYNNVQFPVLKTHQRLIMH